MLNHEEVMALIKLAQQGDEEAKTQLIEQNLPLIKSIVRRYRNKNVEYDDLIQLGSLGLVKSINNFDISFNVKFSTYAVPMIAGEIKKFLRDDGTIKVSRALKSLNMKINNFVSEYKAQNEKEPDLDIIASQFDISTQEVVFTMDSSKYPISLHEKTDKENENSELLNFIPSNENTDDIIDKMLLKDIILALPEREKKVIILRYFRDKTQSEIAKIFGISQVQISRIESKVLEKIKNSLTIK